MICGVGYVQERNSIFELHK